MGAWKNEGDSVTAKLIETSADRTTHQFVVRTELSMSLQVQSNKFAGTGTAFHFDATGKPDGTPRSVAFHGHRILP